MTRIIVDTNIVFSALLNSNGIIGKLINTKNAFEFYSCYLLKIEILRHRNKILKFSKLSSDELLEIEERIFGNIEFINEHLIPLEFIGYAETLTADIDLDDAPFVALNEYLKGKLWTGDKELMNGLSKKGYTEIITTATMAALFSDTMQ